MGKIHSIGIGSNGEFTNTVTQQASMVSGFNAAASGLTTITADITPTAPAVGGMSCG